MIIMTGIMEKLTWEPLKKRRKDSGLIMLYKDVKGAASIPTTDEAYQEAAFPGISDSHWMGLTFTNPAS